MTATTITLDQPTSQDGTIYEATVPFSGNTGYAQKTCLSVQIVNYDHNPSGRDGVAIRTLAIIAPGNMNGSAFGATHIARVGMPNEQGLPPADGAAIACETDIENYGVFQPEPDRSNSKTGLKVVSKGPQAATTGIEIRGKTQIGIFSTPQDIIDKFIWLLGKFIVYADGSVQIGACRLFEYEGHLYLVKGDGTRVMLG